MWRRSVASTAYQPFSNSFFATALDDLVAFYYDAETYDFYFRTRATTPGSFVQPSAFAEMMYDSAVTGQSAGARVKIERTEE
jgi:uncharacterized protein YfaS (alpha-2-macroglobulin family)